MDGIFATLRRFAEEHHVAELPVQLPALSLQCLTPFFGAGEARRGAGRRVIIALTALCAGDIDVSHMLVESRQCSSALDWISGAERGVCSPS